MRHQKASLCQFLGREAKSIMTIWEGSTMSARRALFQKLRLAQVSRPRRTSRPQVSKGVRASVVRSLACLTQTLSRYKSLVILNIETLPKLPCFPPGSSKKIYNRRCTKHLEQRPLPLPSKKPKREALPTHAAISNTNGPPGQLTTDDATRFG